MSTAYRSPMRANPPSEPDIDAESIEDEDEFTSCAHPGRHGCGHCDECITWGDDEYHAQRDDETRWRPYIFGQED